MLHAASRFRFLLDNVPPAIFWVSGLALAFAWGGGRLIPYQGEAFDRPAYLLLGGGLPLTILLIRLLPANWTRWLKLGFAAVFFILSGALLGIRFTPVLILLSAVQLAIAWAVMTQIRLSYAVTALLLSLIGWLTASALIWWRPWLPRLHENAWQLSALIVISSTVTFVSFRKLREATGKRAQYLITAVWMVIFGLASTRLRIDYNDEGFFVGTVELLRQGGWLLWDVPSQYGFLNLQWASWMPVATSWQAVVVANSILLWVSACIFYFRAKLVFHGTSGCLFAGMLTLAAVLMVPGWAPELTGPNMSPSIAAFRFIWVYVLTEILLQIDRRAEDDPMRPWLLLSGCLAWVCSCLWSFESSICGSAIWLPAYSWLVWKKPIFSTRVPSLLLPIALFLAALSIIWSIYRVSLGHGPDWYCYVEFLQAYHAGLGAIPVNWNGAVAFLLGLFAIVLSAAYIVVRESPAHHASVLGAVALICTTSSYFVLRSHENTVTNLVPLDLLAVLTVVSALPQSSTANRFFIRTAWVPFLVMVLFVAYGDFDKSRRYFESMTEKRELKRVDALVPELSGELTGLFDKAGVRSGDPLVLVWTILLPRFSHKLWLPFAPASHFSVLTPERRRIYLDRFVSRVHSGGWLLLPKALAETKKTSLMVGIAPMVNPNYDVFPALSHTHRVGKVYEQNGWVLMEMVWLGENHEDGLVTR